tara:strand:+ start:40 stop:1269 length:1230 start_codon:yes stop_codon:yes gene_type:complete
MPYYPFRKEDVFYNVLKTYPEFTFDVWSGSIFINNESEMPGINNDNVPMVPVGNISLYELNVDRIEGDNTYNAKINAGTKALIFPFVSKNSSLTSIGTVTEAGFNSSFEYGDMITGSYMMSSSIIREYFDTNHSTTNATASHMLALKNTLNYYTYLSDHYSFSSSLGNKAVQEVNLISIPSIFYRSSIKKGSVDLQFYISGTLVARARDIYKDGNLIQMGEGTEFASDQGSGSVAGVVLYNEGFLVLTGSWKLTGQTYDFGSKTRQGKWLDFAAGANDGNSVEGDGLTPSASFQVKFQGVNPISTITMHAHAPKGLLNHSNNPTYRVFQSASLFTTTSSYGYYENTETQIKNTISSSFCNHSASFKKQTFISKVGIYDKDRNLIAVANLAKPVKKLEDRDYTFKLKLDI